MSRDHEVRLQAAIETNRLIQLSDDKNLTIPRSVGDRDVLDLVERGALRKDPGGGRSTSYSLVIDDGNQHYRPTSDKVQPLLADRLRRKLTSCVTDHDSRIWQGAL